MMKQLPEQAHKKNEDIIEVEDKKANYVAHINCIRNLSTGSLDLYESLRYLYEQVGEDVRLLLIIQRLELKLDDFFSYKELAKCFAEKGYFEESLRIVNNYLNSSVEKKTGIEVAEETKNKYIKFIENGLSDDKVEFRKLEAEIQKEDIELYGMRFTKHGQIEKIINDNEYVIDEFSESDSHSSEIAEDSLCKDIGDRTSKNEVSGSQQTSFTGKLNFDNEEQNSFNMRQDWKVLNIFGDEDFSELEKEGMFDENIQQIEQLQSETNEKDVNNSISMTNEQFLCNFYQETSSETNLLDQISPSISIGTASASFHPINNPEKDFGNNEKQLNEFIVNDIEPNMYQGHKKIKTEIISAVKKDELQLNDPIYEKLNDIDTDSNPNEPKNMKIDFLHMENKILGQSNKDLEDENFIDPLIENQEFMLSTENSSNIIELKADKFKKSSIEETMKGYKQETKKNAKSLLKSLQDKPLNFSLNENFINIHIQEENKINTFSSINNLQRSPCGLLIHKGIKYEKIDKKNFSLLREHNGKNILKLTPLNTETLVFVSQNEKLFVKNDTLSFDSKYYFLSKHSRKLRIPLSEEKSENLYLFSEFVKMTIKMIKIGFFTKIEHKKKCKNIKTQEL